MAKQCKPGTKYDGGKLRWGLIPLNSLSEIVKVLTFGAQKYAPDNWQKVENARERYYDALQRHVVAWKMGELTDPESGLPHLAHAGCCLLFMLWFDLIGDK